MNYFQKYLVEEFAEDYQEGSISRREALKLILGVTGSLVLTNSILAACTPVTETFTPTLTAPEAGVPAGPTQQNTTTATEPEATQTQT